VESRASVRSGRRDQVGGQSQRLVGGEAGEETVEDRKTTDQPAVNE